MLGVLLGLYEDQIPAIRVWGLSRRAWGKDFGLRFGA